MSVVLNGTTQYLALVEALAQVEPITIVAFFKSNDVTLGHTLVSMCSSTSDIDYYTLDIRGDQANDPIFANARSSSINAWALTSSGYTANNWHHAAARFKIINERYANLDGGSEGVNTTTVNPSFLSRMAIGVLYRLNPALFMAGKIAEVAIWNLYLTDEELVSLAGGAYPSDIQAGNLLGYWPLLDDANDDSGNAKHLTPVGSPTFNTEDHPIMAGIEELAGSSAGQSTASGKLIKYSLILKGAMAAQSTTQADLTVELATKTLFWRPENKIKEKLVWKTSILRTHRGIEQRIKLRQTPRQLFRLQLVLDTDKINSWYDSILHTWQKKAWKIPVWTEATIHTEDININDTVIYFDTKFADYRDNSYAVIWKSNSEYEVVFINTKTTSQLNLKFDILHSFIGMKYIIPCRIAYIVSTSRRQKYNFPVSIIDIVFAVYDNANITGYTPEMTYDDLDVLILPSYMDEIHQEESDGQIEINDFQTGIFKVRSNKEYNLLSQNHIFLNDSKEACWQYRQLLHSLNGRQKAILIPTFRNDLNLTDTIASADEFFYVENIKLALNMGFNALRTYVGFYFLNKTLLIRKIINIEEIDSTKEKISINTSLGSTVDPGDCKVCFVDKCRLTSDSIEMNWLFAHRNESRTNLTRIS